MPRLELIHGDCLATMKTLPDASVDAIVTDPPAGIAFMGKKWDTFADKAPSQKSNSIPIDPSTGKEQSQFHTFRSRGITIEQSAKGRDHFIDWLCERLSECLRITKPGGLALVWAIPRTSHWTAMAIEDAGWSIENCITHIFGSGFPKQKHLLKPASEHWILARKPGGKLWLGVEDCRIQGQSNAGWYKTLGNGPKFTGTTYNNGKVYEGNREIPSPDPTGRWPANLILSHDPMCKCVGTRRVKCSANDGFQRSLTSKGYKGGALGQRVATDHPMTNIPKLNHADPDGMETVDKYECVENCPVAIIDRQSAENASRFFATFQPDADPFIYIPKPSKSEKSAGLARLPKSANRINAPRKSEAAKFNPRPNHHPTVKSVDMTRWLCRLVCPPGGTIADPFMGSGTTGVACIWEGFGFIGMENDDDYIDIYNGRINHAREQFALFETLTDDPTEAQNEPGPVDRPRQSALSFPDEEPS